MPTSRVITAMLVIAMTACTPDTPDVSTSAPVNCDGAGGEVMHYDTDGAGVWLPGAFTPNSDSVNDTYAARANSIEQFFITIRQGNRVVFQSADYTKSWDGSIAGKPAPEANYAVSVEGRFTQSRPFSLQTHLNLIRTCLNKDGTSCTSGDQFTDRGFITGSISGDPLLNCP
ncbi:T9SS type B sorting domain-containing protein [Spirosoma validum]|uniref:Gliding motility-associated C-terminal domain-containing protein n=1 Tax=Spirosoma validum TaxID=2771355 RepID=A0A927B517_9BACT|nr:gliding motility-associated C-terminal domain-containing protein [Spirosoma validum]MBD2755372.1 gliding motility-associated C-terminal domain-containing protein [Spirosoma validum]